MRARAALSLVASIAVGLVAICAVRPSSASGAPARRPSTSSSLLATVQSTSSFLSGDSKTNCVEPDSNLTDLAMLSSLVGTTYNCVLLFNDAKPDWQTWTNVWWASPPSSGSNWLGWLAGEPGRRLIISQPMVPNDVPSNWAQLGADGEYDSYATDLAENLVKEGMGNSIIRLGWEANDPSNPENALPTDPNEYGDWATYWANIVTSMRAVPGADFQFDWTINQYYQPIPLQEWYPGDDYVNIIGIDAYDSGVYQSGLTPEQRWQQLYEEPDGLAAVAAFAAEHGKPLSIPEWGLATTAVGGAGDDPAYTQGLGSFIADNDVEYNSYFYSAEPDNLVYLPDAPQSLSAYQSYFPNITTPTLSSSGSSGSSGLTSTSTTTTTTAATSAVGTTSSPTPSPSVQPSSGGAGTGAVALPSGAASSGGSALEPAGQSGAVPSTSSSASSGPMPATATAVASQSPRGKDASEPAKSTSAKSTSAKSKSAKSKQVKSKAVKSKAATRKSDVAGGPEGTKSCQARHASQRSKAGAPRAAGSTRKAGLESGKKSSGKGTQRCRPVSISQAVRHKGRPTRRPQQRHDAAHLARASRAK